MLRLGTLFGGRTLRISIHADVLTTSDADSAEIQPGFGLLIARDILDSCRPRQILVSQSYLLRLVGELDRICGQDTSGIRILAASRLDPESARAPLRVVLLHRRSESGGPGLWGPGLWGKDSLRGCLEGLRVPPDMVKSLTGDWLTRTGFSQQGIFIGDIGNLTGRHGERHRVFNLWGSEKAPQDAAVDTPVQGYGEARPPLSRPTLLPRDEASTAGELRALIESIDKVRHLTIYGYSNVRLLSTLLQKLRGDGPFATSFKEHLESLRIIFYDYEQIVHINERKSSYVARMGWINGFRLAMELKEKFPDNTQVLINHVRYGFNVLKAIYSSEAEARYRDQIRLTVPIPGRSFELAPVFALYRGDPWFHEYLEICEHYLEQGRLENNNRIAVAEFKLAAEVDKSFQKDHRRWVEDLEHLRNEDDFKTFVEKVLSPNVDQAAPSVEIAAVSKDAAKAFCATMPGLPFEPQCVRDVASELWCLKKVVEFAAPDGAIGNPIAPGFIEPA